MSGGRLQQIGEFWRGGLNIFVFGAEMSTKLSSGKGLQKRFGEKTQKKRVQNPGGQGKF